MEVYLDNSATTAVLPEVADIVAKAMTEDYGNPSSMHRKGIEAEKYIRNAKEIIAKSLKVKEKELIFTSGGTESNNLALIGMAEANKRAGKHIITSCIEHPSVQNTLKYLEEQGFDITWLPVDEKGHVSITNLKKNLRKDTILVSVMYVNNEIGALQSVEEISKIVKEYNSNIILHTDAVQAFGKYRIYPKKQGIDALSVSGHKIHAPKGIGFLYVSEKIKIKPILFGGGQQRNMRSGTDNVPGIAGIGEAVRRAYENFDEKIDNMFRLKNYFIDRLSQLENIKINSQKDKKSAPHIINASFCGVRSEVMLHALEDKNIYVSAGSACSSNHPHISETLSGIGLSLEKIDSALRFSFSEYTSMQELDYTINCIKELLPVLRKFTKKK